MSLAPGRLFGPEQPAALPASFPGRSLRKPTPYTTGYDPGYDPGFYRAAVAPHVDSFNQFLDNDLAEIVRHHRPWRIALPGDTVATVDLLELQVGHPAMTPADCREASISYTAPFEAQYKVVLGPYTTMIRLPLGQMPIMVGSRRCLLSGKTPLQLVEAREDERDPGGYFLSKGTERIFRVTQVPRRNSMACMERRSFTNQAIGSGPLAVMFRSVRSDHRSQTIFVQPLRQGGCGVRFRVRRTGCVLQLPLVLRALVETTDKEMYDSIANGNPYVDERVEIMLSDFHQLDVWSTGSAQAFIGRAVRGLFPWGASLDPRMTDAELGRRFLHDHLFWHLNDCADVSPMPGSAASPNHAKFNLLCAMATKAYMLAGGFLQVDNQDAVNNHELSLVGSLFSAVLSDLLGGLQWRMERLVQTFTKRAVTNVDSQRFCSLFSKLRAEYVGAGLMRLISVGDISPVENLDVQQLNGFSVTGDRLNYVRFLANLRSVHRGSFFSGTKLTSVRKLLPEGFGFLCAVNTPDGAPCGILNHLTATAQPVIRAATKEELKAIVAVVARAGLVPENCNIFNRSQAAGAQDTAAVPVLLDGVVLGCMAAPACERLVPHLRALKCRGVKDPAQGVYPYMEIVYIPPDNKDSLYPSLSLFTSANRFIRPVLSLQEQAVEYVGSMEQVFMYIDIGVRDLAGCGVDPEDGAGRRSGRAGAAYTHRELDPMAFLSITASLVPFADHNQSPRNMYECQMLKQTMGVAYRASNARGDTKEFRITTPQRPLVRNSYLYERGGFNTHPTGTNAVVAVLAYTGYDMEDACVINKSSIERGIFHGEVYTTHIIDLLPSRGSSRAGVAFLCNTAEAVNMRGFGEAGPGQDGSPDQQDGFEPLEGFEGFEGAESPGGSGGPESADTLESPGSPEGEGSASGLHYICPELDADGLPTPGQRICKGDPFYVTFSPERQKFRIETYGKGEPGVVCKVIVLGTTTIDGAYSFGTRIVRAKIILRHDRTPTIGDKFASRHGQKGVLSIKWPSRDMPFTAGGIVPDLIINPHAFPSRMTIGMLLESVAGKYGAMSGEPTDSTPFRYSDDCRAVDVLGNKLLGTGLFNRYGSELMYSGVSGEPLACDIFIGVVYYQRLRHMITDKFQVRATGKIDEVTKQPVKGRKLGGGGRFGEMERDALLAHGAMALLRGRLCTDSDAVVHKVCRSCGSILGFNEKGSRCAECGARDQGATVMIPCVAVVLAQELAAMNIRMQVSVRDLDHV